MPLTPSTTGFPPEARLHTPADYSRVFKCGIRTANSHFRMYAYLNNGAKARLGITVARKTVPSAVVRNRIKRQVRESFRSHRRILPAADIVVQAKLPAATADNAAIRSSLEWHWQELMKRCEVS